MNINSKISSAAALPLRSPRLIAATTFAARPPPTRSSCSAPSRAAGPGAGLPEPGTGRRGRHRDPEPASAARSSTTAPTSRPAPSSSTPRTPTSTSCSATAGDALRHRRRPRRLHLGGHADHHPHAPSGRTGRPPAEMIARQPYLPRYMAGGPGNPMGARALYLGTHHLSHPRHQRPAHHRPARVLRLHPPDQRRRRRPLQPRERRHQGGRDADQRQPPRRHRPAADQLSAADLISKRRSRGAGVAFSATAPA